MDFFNYRNEVKPLRFRFSDGGGDPNGGGASNGADNKAATGEGAKEVTTFDDILKDKSYQAEFDRRIAKALETARGKWQAEAEERLTEAQKVANMNTEEKAKHEREKREKALEKREADIARRELTYTAKGVLSEKGLPTELSDLVDYSSAESCTKSIETIEKVFRTAVEKAVDKRISANSGTPNGGNGKTMSGVEAAFYGMNPSLKK